MTDDRSVGILRRAVCTLVFASIARSVICVFMEDLKFLHCFLSMRSCYFRGDDVGELIRIYKAGDYY